MSAPICYRIKTPSDTLPVASAHDFISKIEDMFSPVKRNFSKIDLKKLKVLQSYEYENKAAFEKLIELIEKYGEIEVWVQY